MSETTTTTTTEAVQASEKAHRRRFAMTPRELIDIGVFAALYIVTAFLFVLVGLVAPPLMPFSLAIGIVAASIPFVLFLQRVTHPGQVFLFVLVAAGLQLLTGHPVAGVLFALVLAAVVEVVLFFGGYRKRATSVCSSALFAAWNIGPFLPLLYIGHDEMLTGRMAKIGGDRFVQLDSGTIALTLLGMALIMVALGTLGGLLATRVLRRHFVRAGLA